MIQYFQIECAFNKGVVTVESICEICASNANLSISGLKLLSGTVPTMKLSGYGKMFADCLASKHFYFPLFFSDRVVKAIENRGLRGLEIGRVDIEPSNAKAINQISHSAFFQARPMGDPIKFKYRVFEWNNSRYEYRFETEEKSDPRLLPGFGSFTPQVQKIPIGTDFEKWDFFRISDKFSTYGSGGFFCSRRFLELAYEFEFTNFSFTPIDMLGKLGGDFLKKPWPPELWYPANHPK